MLKQNLIKRGFLSFIILAIIISLFSGCSNSKNALISEWSLKEGENGWYTIIFYEDGQLEGITSKYSFSVLSDGTLKIFGNAGSDIDVYKKVSSKEPNRSDEYYLKGNTLIFQGAEYERKK